MTDDTFRFAIKRDDTTWCRMSPTGTLQFITDEHFLENAPDKWADISLGLGRQDSYMGLFMEYTPKSFEMALEGAEILKELFRMEGPEAVAIFYVEAMNYSTYQYEYYFSAAFNFSTYDEGRSSVAIEVKEGGVAAMLEANEETEYEIEIASPLLVKIDPMILKGYSKWVSAPPDPSVIPSVIDQVNVELQNVGDAISVTNQSGFYRLIFANKPIKNIRIKGYLKFYMDNQTGSTDNFALRIIQSGAILHTLYTDSVATGNVKTNSVNVDLTIPSLNANEYLVYQINGASDISWDTNCALEMFWEYATNEFTVAGLRAFDVAKALFNKMTGGVATLSSTVFNVAVATYSQYIDLKPYDIVMTSGHAICGVNTSGHSCPVIKTSFREWFNNFKKILDIGININGNAVAVKEARSYFNKDLQIYHIQNVHLCRIKYSKDDYFNRVKVGYAAKEYDEYNGRNEFNTNHTYTLPMSSGGAVELDMSCSYRTDMYGILFTWLRYNVTNISGSIDTDVDNDVFLISVATNPVDGFYHPLRLAGVVGGLEPNDPNAFNFGLTPTRNFLRCMGLVRSLLWKQTGIIRFEKGDKNVELESRFSTIYTVDENGSFTVESLNKYAAPYFAPVLFEVECAVPENFVRLVRDNPDGYISFEWKGKIHKGYPKRVFEYPGRVRKQTLLLKAAPDSEI